MENKYNGWYYKGMPKWEKNRTDKFIEENKNEKKWHLSLYFSIKRLIKYQRTKGLIFWEGYCNDFDNCKTSDLTKYNGLFTFEEAFELAKNFPLLDGELIRINYGSDDYTNLLILVRD